MKRMPRVFAMVMALLISVDGLLAVAEEIETASGKVIVTPTAGKTVEATLESALRKLRADKDKVAIAALDGLGAHVVLNDKGRVIEVSLRQVKNLDAALLRVKTLDRLASLSLAGTQVTNAELRHLKGLTHLEVLDLQNTSISDVGLENLRGLSIKKINIANSKVSNSKIVVQVLPAVKLIMMKHVTLER